AHNQVQPLPDVVAVDPSVGAYVLNTQPLGNAQVTATLGGTTYSNGDVLTLTFSNAEVSVYQVPASFTLSGGATPTSAATGLAAAINATPTLTANNISATSSGAVITIVAPGTVANQTLVQFSKSGSGTETVTFNPPDGYLSGGQGTAGIPFSGAPVAYNGVNAMPQPNSVCFQDGYLFFSVGDGHVF